MAEKKTTKQEEVVVINNAPDIERNINFFLKLADFAKGLFIFLIVMSVFYLLMAISSDEEELATIFLIVAIASGIMAIIVPHFIRWKSYTLQCLYDINKKRN